MGFYSEGTLENMIETLRDLMVIDQVSPAWEAANLGNTRHLLSGSITDRHTAVRNRNADDTLILKRIPKASFMGISLELHLQIYCIVYASWIAENNTTINLETLDLLAERVRAFDLRLFKVSKQIASEVYSAILINCTFMPPRSIFYYIASDEQPGSFSQTLGCTVLPRALFHEIRSLFMPLSWFNGLSDLISYQKDSPELEIDLPNSLSVIHVQLRSDSRDLICQPFVERSSFAPWRYMLDEFQKRGIKLRTARRELTDMGSWWKNPDGLCYECKQAYNAIQVRQFSMKLVADNLMPSPSEDPTDILAAMGVEVTD